MEKEEIPALALEGSLKQKKKKRTSRCFLPGAWSENFEQDNSSVLKDALKLKTINDIYDLFVPQLLSPLILDTGKLISFITTILEDIYPNWDEFFHNYLLPSYENDFDKLLSDSEVSVEDTISEISDEEQLKLYKKLELIIPNFLDFCNEGIKCKFDTIILTYLTNMINLDGIDFSIEIRKYVENHGRGKSSLGPALNRGESLDLDTSSLFSQIRIH